ncbi:MAG: hypothetical protein U0841_31160 [Chloroflexia bacterium]
MSNEPRGIVLTPAEIASEGLDVVLDNVARTGATAISTSLGVLVPGRPGDGVREPPLDIAGQARILDRPLWGQRELLIKAYEPHEPDPANWEGLAYAPPKVAPPEHRRDVVREIITAARARGLAAHIQVSPYTLPGAPGGQSTASGHGQGNLADRPVRIDGSIAERAVAGHGCLNNPRVRALGRARLREAIRHYADVDGIFLDWAEYTCYLLEDCFTCFCPSCRTAATEAGYDWDRMERATRSPLGSPPPPHARRPPPRHRHRRLALHRRQQPARRPRHRRSAPLQSRDSARCDHRTPRRARRGRVPIGAAGSQRLRAPLVARHRHGLRRDRPGRQRDPLQTLHLPLAADHPLVVRIAPRLEPHPRRRRRDPRRHRRARPSRARQRSPAAPGRLPHARADRAAPDHPGRAHPQAQPGRRARAGNGAPCQAYIHSYRPADEFAATLAAASASNAHGCWVQRYGYLSDEKLAILRDTWGG